MWLDQRERNRDWRGGKTPILTDPPLKKIEKRDITKIGRVLTTRSIGKSQQGTPKKKVRKKSSLKEKGRGASSELKALVGTGLEGCLGLKGIRIKKGRQSYSRSDAFGAVFEERLRKS